MPSVIIMKPIKTTMDDQLAQVKGLVAAKDLIKS